MLYIRGGVRGLRRMGRYGPVGGDSTTSIANECGGWTGLDFGWMIARWIIRAPIVMGCMTPFAYLQTCKPICLPVCLYHLIWPQTQCSHPSTKGLGKGICFAARLIGHGTGRQSRALIRGPVAKRSGWRRGKAGRFVHCVSTVHEDLGLCISSSVLYRFQMLSSLSCHLQMLIRSFTTTHEAGLFFAPPPLARHHTQLE